MEEGPLAGKHARIPPTPGESLGWKSRGGTLYTANYALSAGIPVKNLANELKC